MFGCLKMNKIVESDVMLLSMFWLGGEMFMLIYILGDIVYKCYVLICII